MKIAVTSDLHYKGVDHFLKVFFEDLKEEEFDIFVEAGDLKHTRNTDMLDAFRLIRKHVHCPYYRVNGNHDFWGLEPYPEMMAFQKQWHKDYNVMYLPDQPYKDDDILITGFDGWYKTNYPSSKDRGQLPIGISMEALMQKATRDFDEKMEFLKTFNGKRVMVTHFATHKLHPLLNPLMNGPPWMFDEMVKEVDLLIEGHSHFPYDKKVDRCRIVNAGSDYDVPRYKIVEI